MATTSEVGISPALLQAITQTLSTNRSGHGGRDVRESGGPERIVITGDKPMIKMEGSGQPHILHGMNEPVSNIAQLGSGETVIVLQNMEGGECVGVDSVQGASQHVIIKNMPAGGMQNVVLDNSEKDAGGQDVNMGSVLSAIATQLRNEQPPPTAGGEDNSQDVPIEDSQHPIYISVSGNNSVPSPVQDVTVQEVAENIVAETVVQTTHNIDTTDPKQLRIIEPNIQSQNGASIVLNSQTGQERAVLEAVKGDGGETHYVYRTVRVDQPATSQQLTFDASEACPICGDKISGKLLIFGGCRSLRWVSWVLITFVFVRCVLYCFNIGLLTNVYTCFLQVIIMAFTRVKVARDFSKEQCKTRKHLYATGKEIVS